MLPGAVGSPGSGSAALPRDRVGEGRGAGKGLRGFGGIMLPLKTDCGKLSYSINFTWFIENLIACHIRAPQQSIIPRNSSFTNLES